jgi:hypothetical protein
MKRALIATPVYGGAHPHYVTSLDDLRVLEPAWRCIPHIRTGSLITLARNGMAAHFLKNTVADVLMWIDSDEGFRPEDVASVLEMALERGAACAPYREKPITAGELDWPAIAAAAKRGVAPNELQYVGQKLTIDFRAEDVSVKRVENVKGYTGPVLTKFGRRFVRVAHCGAGFLAVSRSALEKVYEMRADFEVRGGMRDCFSSGVSDGRYIGEDFAFCDHLTAAGVDIWCDTSARVVHYGLTGWEGTLEGAHLDEYVRRVVGR